MKEIMIVAFGGSIGAVCRYLVGNWTLARFGAGFPYATLIVNVTGCFIIGFFMNIISEKMLESQLFNSYARLLIATGFLGALTTFSAYSYETFLLIERGNVTLAFYNTAANLIVGFFSTWLGMNMARLILKFSI